VFTPDGRRVRTLLDGERPAGAFEMVWDGTDDAGTRLASGVYLVRLRAGERTDGGKLLLLQ